MWHRSVDSRRKRVVSCPLSVLVFLGDLERGGDAVRELRSELAVLECGGVVEKEFVALVVGAEGSRVTT